MLIEPTGDIWQDIFKLIVIVVIVTAFIMGAKIGYGHSQDWSGNSKRSPVKPMAKHVGRIKKLDEQIEVVSANLESAAREAQRKGLFRMALLIRRSVEHLTLHRQAMSPFDIEQWNLLAIEVIDTCSNDEIG